MKDDGRKMGRSWLSTIVKVIVGTPALILIGLVRLYQWTLSPIFGRQCRFQPSCSAYFISAVKKYGAIRGMARHRADLPLQSWNPGGYDPP